MIIKNFSLNTVILFKIFLFLKCWCIAEVVEDIFKENVMKTWKNTSFYAFRGIRYAQPPVNELRFKDPEPYPESSFEHLHLANLTTDGNGCPSPYSIDKNEDCLFLNVYTKNLTASFPVIVFIHPGGFYIGSGRSDEYGPEFLMEKDIVLVTFNYRLGFFGFLSTGDSRAPGNAALKDQVLALKWVRKNIGYFGGNDGDVTLMGASAGAMSVGLHLVSDMSVGLFNKAITISGGILPQLQLPIHQRDLIERQGQILKCENDFFDCLIKANTTIIAESVYAMFEFGRDNPIFLWQPVIENSFGQERFLKSQPNELLEKYKFQRIPLLSGFVRNELADSAFQIISNNSLNERWRTYFQDVAPICLQYEKSSERSINISANIWQEFFRRDITFNEITEVFSEALIIHPTYKLVKLMSQFSNVFLYKFSYKGLFSTFSDKHKVSTEQYSLNEQLSISNVVEHLDDLSYIFTSKNRNIYNLNNDDAATVEILTELIASFASNGRPTIDKCLHPIFSSNNSNYIDISNTVTTKHNPFPRFPFWSMVFQ